MCFSAPASFIASGVLTTLGLANKKQIKEKSDYLLGAMPFIFALQQAIEGTVWLTLGTPIQFYLSSAFLFFSHFFWPAYVPLAFYTQETNPETKKILKFFIPIGLIVAFYIGGSVLLNGFYLSNHQHHLSYTFNIKYVEVATAIYLIATVLPSAFSSNKTLKFFSFTLAASYIFSAFAYREASISVWCFFGAILSSIIIFHLRQKNLSSISS